MGRSRRPCAVPELAHCSELVFSASSGCSPVLADQVVDDLSALDPGGHVDRLAGLVQRGSLLPRLMGPLHRLREGCRVHPHRPHQPGRGA
jgi:hypothetical protein